MHPAVHRAWKRTDDPAVEPVTLAEAKEQVREDGSDSDTLIAALITAAREYVEERTGRALITQTWSLAMDGPPCGNDAIRLPRPPLQSVTSVVYVDEAGADQTWAVANYRVDTHSEPARIALASDAVWPIPQFVAGAVTVTYVAGYGDTPDTVPQAIRQAILLLVGHWYDHRSPEVVGTVVGRVGFTVDALLAPYVVQGFGE